MIGRISNSIDHAHRRVQKVEPIEVIAPSQGSGQDAQEQGKVPSGVSPGLDLATAFDSHEAEVRVRDNDASDCQDGQEHQTPLQEQIERQAKDVKSYIDAKDRVCHVEGTPVTKAEISVPLGVEAQGKERRNSKHNKCHESHHRIARDRNTLYFDDMRLPLRTGLFWPVIFSFSQCETVSGRLTDIDPQEKERGNESNTGHAPFDRKQRPENLRVVEFSHPQPLLQQVGNCRYGEKKQHQNRNNPFQQFLTTVGVLLSNRAVRVWRKIMLVNVGRQRDDGFRDNGRDGHDSFLRKVPLAALNLNARRLFRLFVGMNVLQLSAALRRRPSGAIVPFQPSASKSCPT